MAMTLQMFQRGLEGLFVAESFTVTTAKTNQCLRSSTRTGRRSIPQLDIAIMMTLRCKLLNPSQSPQPRQTSVFVLQLAQEEDPYYSWT